MPESEIWICPLCLVVGDNPFMQFAHRQQVHPNETRAGFDPLNLDDLCVSVVSVSAAWAYAVACLGCDIIMRDVPLVTGQLVAIHGHAEVPALDPVLVRMGVSISNPTKIIPSFGPDEFKTHGVGIVALARIAEIVQRQPKSRAWLPAERLGMKLHPIRKLKRSIPLRGGGASTWNLPADLNRTILRAILEGR